MKSVTPSTWRPRARAATRWEISSIRSEAKKNSVAVPAAIHSGVASRPGNRLEKRLMSDTATSATIMIQPASRRTSRPRIRPSGMASQPSDARRRRGILYRTSTGGEGTGGLPWRTLLKG